MNLKFMSKMTGTPAWSQGFELSSYSDVVNNAMHLYGPPVPGDIIPPLTSGIRQVRLFPCMYFTCSGTATKLMFIADSEADDHSDTGNITTILSTLIFGIWRKQCSSSQSQICFWEEVQKGLISISQYPRLVNSSNAVRVYELELNIRFQQSDILGIRHYHYYGDVIQQRTLRYQNGGGYCDPVVYEYYTEGSRRFTFTSMESSRDPAIVPYIAIETGKIYVSTLTMS